MGETEMDEINTLRRERDEALSARDCARVEKDGAIQRSLMMLGAKTYWRDRALAAEASAARPVPSVALWTMDKKWFVMHDGPADFEQAPSSITDRIACAVMNLPWAKLGLDRHDVDGLANRHGDVQNICDAAFHLARTLEKNDE